MNEETETLRRQLEVDLKAFYQIYEPTLLRLDESIGDPKANEQRMISLNRVMRSLNNYLDNISDDPNKENTLFVNQALANVLQGVNNLANPKIQNEFHREYGTLNSKLNLAVRMVQKNNQDFQLPDTIEETKMNIFSSLLYRINTQLEQVEAVDKNTSPEEINFKLKALKAYMRELTVELVKIKDETELKVAQKQHDNILPNIATAINQLTEKVSTKTLDETKSYIRDVISKVEEEQSGKKSKRSIKTPPRVQKLIDTIKKGIIKAKKDNGGQTPPTASKG